MALQEELEQQGIWLFKYRGKLPVIVLLIGAMLYLQTKIYPNTFFIENTPYEIYYEFFCLSISLLGLSIRIYTVGHTPKNTSGRNRNEQIAETLNTSGSYSLVRHPIYLGNFFMWMGPALLTGNFWFLVAFCFPIGSIMNVSCLPKNNFLGENSELFTRIGPKKFLPLYLILRNLKSQNKLSVG